MPEQNKFHEDEQTQVIETEDFIVSAPSGILRSSEITPIKTIDELANDKIEQAVRSYDFDKKTSSVILETKGSITDPTIELLSMLAEYPQNDINKILQINKIIAKYVNMDDIIGKTIEAIKTNVNSATRLSYAGVSGRNKEKALFKAKDVIGDFNKEIKLKRLIRDSIPRAYQEGTVIMYLRKDESGGWCVDFYPLGVALIAPYSLGNEPVCLLDMTELKSRLQKSGLLKTRKGKNIFFPTIEEEIKNNYPKEVLTAYLNKDPYAKLDIRYTGVIRIGNNFMKYGLSPIFRALFAAIALQGLYRSDEINSRAKSKKILVQLLRKETLGTDLTKNSIPAQAYAHSELIAAYKQSGSCAITAPGTVQDIKYVEPKSELVDIRTILFHMQRIMSTLGIAFLSPDSSGQSVSTANISLDQLMKTINSISEQLEEVLNKWYAQILIDEGYDPSYAPEIQVLDSEALDAKLRKDFAQFIYSTLNLSLKTTLELLNIDVENERMRREQENSDGLDRIFYPRQSIYTQSNNDSNTTNTGRPPSETQTDKTEYDQNYNLNRK